MDPVTLLFYALVCGGLGAAGPRLGRLWVRIVIGAAVGFGAAAALPWLRAALQV